MTFLTPWMLGAGVLAALGVVALHLLTTRRPPAAALPTARFVPESDVRAVARASRPTDLLLLALRALAVLAIGAAFARPVLDAPGPSVRAVVAIEWSVGVVDPEALRVRAQELIGSGDALVLFGADARVVDPSALDTLTAPSAGPRSAELDPQDADAAREVPARVASLGPMFVAARDAAATIARGADSVRLVVLSTVAPEAFDAASGALRASWPGRVELLRVDGIADTARAPRVVIEGADADDPLVPALALLPANRGAHEVRIARAGLAASVSNAGAAAVGLSAADSLWLREAPSRVLVRWPAIGEAPVAGDGVSAVATGGTAPTSGATLVAPFARLDIGGGRVVARWRDGTPAATEQTRADIGSGSCIRTVGVGLPAAGDLTLRAPFAHFLAAMLAPCGGARSPTLPDSALAWLTADGPLAAGSSLAARPDDASPFTRWLLAAAVMLLVTEQFLRGRTQRSIA